MLSERSQSEKAKPYNLLTQHFRKYGTTEIVQRSMVARYLAEDEGLGRNKDKQWDE